MPTLAVQDERVVVHFSGRQAMMALVREVSVPVGDITAVSVVDNGCDIDLGRRVGGAGIPRRLAFGRFRQGKSRTFAAVYCGTPALVIDTAGGDWDRLVLTLDDVPSAAAQVRKAAGLG